jgi:hypothetical protein
MPEHQAGNAQEDPQSTPDIILPSQYFELTGTHRMSSEQRLLLAVLVDAINILQGWRQAASVRKRNMFAETEQWVFSPGGGQPFSFESVCEGLGIDAKRLRHQLSNLPSHDKPIRLRLKESSRVQRVTVNRVRRRSRRYLRQREQTNGNGHNGSAELGS